MLVLYKGIEVYFRKVTYINLVTPWDELCPLIDPIISWNELCPLVELCPLCNKKIDKGESLYMITNNCQLLPNLYVHETCAPSKEKCIEQLVKMYEEFKEIKKKYKFWFGKICIQR